MHGMGISYLVTMNVDQQLHPRQTFKQDRAAALADCQQLFAV